MMGRLSAPSVPRQPLRRPWPRSRPLRWARPNGLLPPAAVFALIPSLPRCELARLTTRMIDRMDEIDGADGLELNGDELDGHLGEDEFLHQAANWLGYPGCPIADPAEDGHDREAE